MVFRICSFFFSFLFIVHTYTPLFEIYGLINNLQVSRSNLHPSPTSSKMCVKMPKGHDNRFIELCYNGNSFIDFLGQFLLSCKVYCILYSPWYMELSHTRLSLSKYMCSLPNSRCLSLYQYMDAFLIKLISIEKQQTLLLNTWLY